MNVIAAVNFRNNRRSYYQKIKQGAVFIYPTDTIYGIGCDATNQKAVLKIRRLKQRNTKPFSIIAPSKHWIRENCVVSKSADKWLKKLPGPYTLLLPLKNKNAVAKAVTNSNIIGVRIPNNWSKNIARSLKKPVVSTSANITSRKHMTTVKDLERSIAEGVDFIVDEGRKRGRPSTIIDTINDVLKKR